MVGTLESEGAADFEGCEVKEGELDLLGRALKLGWRLKDGRLETEGAADFVGY